MKRLLLPTLAIGMLVCTLDPSTGSGSLRAQSRDGGAPARLSSYGEPGISPDGNLIAFVTGGDIWEVSSKGGDARLLVSHPATESRPLYSPDGKRLAFTSSRTGNGDVYVLRLDTGEVTRLTFDDAPELVSGWSADGSTIYFQSVSHELAGVFDVYGVNVEGGTPIVVAGDRYTTEYFASGSPAGDAVAITARGNAGAQWWRKGHSHLDESEIWIVRGTAYSPVTSGGAKDAWPMWAPDGKTLFFMSDRSGAQNIWSAPAATNAGSSASAKAVTSFRDGRVLWPTISSDGKTIAFERDFGIWTVNVSTGRAQELPIALRGAPAATTTEHRVFTDQIQELAVSPDAKKLAFAVSGDIFSASAKDGGDAARVTTTAAEEAELTWAPDSRRLVYRSDREGVAHLFQFDFGTSEETRLTSAMLGDHQPRFSPDGKWIAFERGSRELRVIEVSTRRETLVASGVFDTPPFPDSRDFVWSPDSRAIAYVAWGQKAFTNVYVAPIVADVWPGARVGQGQAVSFLANAYGGSLSWSPDGTFLTLATAQRTEPGEVIRIDLVPRTPRFREDQFRDLFKDEQPRQVAPPPPAPAAPASTPQTPAAPSPAATTPAAAAPPPKTADAASDDRGTGSRRTPKQITIAFDDIRLRATTLPVGVDVSRQEISPDGKLLLLTASAAGQQNLYVYSIDELSREPAIARQLTSAPGGKSNAHFTDDSKEVYYLDRGRVFTINVDRRDPRAVFVRAEMDVNFDTTKGEVFTQAWTYLRDQFFDDKMNGVDWNGVRANYEPRIAGARTPDEMRRLISLMLGELNASHMGIGGPGGGQNTLGRLAVDFDADEYRASGRLRVATVVPLGPADVAGIRPGDYVRSVDRHTVERRSNIDEWLDHTVDRRLSVTIASSATGPARDVAVKPVDLGTERGLRYRAWVEQRRAYVDKASRGRLGYVHMYDMSSNALSQLRLDLDAQNHGREGVVIDIRNNNGGFVNVYAIDVFARRGYFNMTSRGFPTASSRTLLGQRALELPTILVTNQHSLSDAEDFTEGYRTLKLGKVVGEPTAGWIIYTGSVALIDGSVLRMPSTKIMASDGTPMEMHPRPVDVAVKRPVGESYSGKDSQLDAAVAELLRQLGPARGATQ